MKQAPTLQIKRERERQKSAMFRYIAGKRKREI